MADKILISYNGGKAIVNNQCPYRDYAQSEDEGVCNNPFRKYDLLCGYGHVTDKVPDECPFKDSNLIKKISLLEEHK